MTAMRSGFKAGRRPALYGALIAVSGVVLVGCGSSSSSSKTTSSSAAPAAAPTTTAPASTAAGTLAVTANASGQLKFDQTSLSAKAGKVTIVMKNPSSAAVQHGVAVEGNGVDKSGQVVAPGETSTVTATLKPGTYTFYCPFDGHKAQGMKGTLTVT